MDKSEKIKLVTDVGKGNLSDKEYRSIEGKCTNPAAATLHTIFCVVQNGLKI